MMEPVRGSVMTLSRSGASSPPWMLKESIRTLVSLYSIPDATSRGSSTSTDSQLKKSWTVAPANALERGFGKGTIRVDMTAYGLGSGAGFMEVVRGHDRGCVGFVKLTG